MASAQQLNRLDRSRLALEAGRSVDTVRRVYRGKGNAYSRTSIVRAAEKLGLPPPPSETPMEAHAR